MPARANEGQWKPDQIAAIHERASKLGLTLTPEQVWNAAGDERTGGLLRAAVNLNGCSAAFVSADGLIATNHHCAYGALQANSSVEHDYLKDGFLAKTRADELPAKGTKVKVLRSVTDVTAQIEAAVEGITNDVERASTLDKTIKQIVEQCEAPASPEAGPSHVHCKVASFFGGSLYELHSYVELGDVRLVYAPPAAIGEYGGETDNWMWPRHTGDFSLLRAYAGPDGQPAAFAEGNVPYKPAQWLKPAPEGVEPGQFVAVLGYPGVTDRHLWAAEVQRHYEQFLPLRASIYAEWIAILEAAGKTDPAVAIKVAATKKSLANREKNARGKLDGLKRMNLIDTRVAEDARLAQKDEAAKAVLDALEQISAARRERAERAFLLENLANGPRTLVIARDLVLWARERQKQDDLDRLSGYQDRDKDGLKTRLEQRVKDYDPAVDVELMASFLAHADALADGQRIAGFDRLLGDAKGKGAALGADASAEQRRAVYVDAAKQALEGSSLADLAAVQKLFDDPAAVRKSKDPLIVLARALSEDLDALEQIDKAERGKLVLLNPRYFELLKGLRGEPLYPDANGTLRFSFATIRGYTKPDGSEQKPQTVLAEAVAKHKGEGEFDLPDNVLAAASSAPQTRWADPALGDLPLCFLADGDTTGGNSGSPVIDGQGRLVGFNFDRVWETVAGDYAWKDEQSRNVIADVRYLLWMLDAVEHADHLLAELGVADFQGPPKVAIEESAPAGDEAKSDSKDAAKREDQASSKGGAAGGCACTLEPGGPTGVLGGLSLLGLLGLGLHRRPRRS